MDALLAGPRALDTEGSVEGKNERLAGDDELSGREPPTDAAGRRRIRRRRDRMRLAIRSALAGVALALLTAAPALADSPTYTVQPGDTLSGIADRYGLASADLVAVNEIPNPDAVSPGQVIRIPDGPQVRPAPAARGNRDPAPRGGSFVWPVQGPITTQYGELGPFWGKGYHPGVDIGVPVGTPIGACGDGVVVEAEADGWNSGYGHYVKIDHGNGIYSLYGHMSTVSASVGDRVTAGTVIGRVGMTGFTTGPHLHWEIRIGGSGLTAPTRNPLSFLS